MSTLRHLQVLRRANLHRSALFKTRGVPGSQYHASRVQRKQEEGPGGEPFPYMSNKDTHWVALNTFLGPDIPKAQGISVALSITALLLYFGILREENDFDQELSKTLYDRVPGFEEQQLIGAIATYKQFGRDTDEYEKRLAEVLAEKEKRQEA